MHLFWLFIVYFLLIFFIPGVFKAYHWAVDKCLQAWWYLYQYTCFMASVLCLHFLFGILYLMSLRLLYLFKFPVYWSCALWCLISSTKYFMRFLVTFYHTKLLNIVRVYCYNVWSLLMLCYIMEYYFNPLRFTLKII